MELRHLSTVVAIARHGSFTKAGEELHLAQSAVSQQLSRLQSELGITLFHRSSRSVDITAEGELVLDYAQRVIAEVDGLRDELDEMAGLLRGDLRLGGMWPTGLYDLYAVIADFHERHPGVAIHFVEGTQDEMLAQIRADELDAIFTAVDPDALDDEFGATLLSEEEFVCTLPVGHPLAAQDHVTFQQLAGLDLVIYRENSALRRRLELAMGEHGLTPRNAFICTENGRGPRARLQGDGRRGHPALGGRGARPADRASPDRAAAVHVAGRARLARAPPPAAGGEGVSRAGHRAGRRGNGGAARAARRLERLLGEVVGDVVGVVRRDLDVARAREQHLAARAARARRRAARARSRARGQRPRAPPAAPAPAPRERASGTTYMRLISQTPGSSSGRRPPIATGRSSS